MSVAGVTPGSIRELPARTVADRPNRSLPVNRFSTRAAAALNVEWPDANSPNGGVGKVDGW
jgi:hypothetical protein